MIKSIVYIACFSLFSFQLSAQEVMNPKTLVELNRVSPIGLSSDKQNVLYSISKVDVLANKKSNRTYILPLSGGNPKEITDVSDFIIEKDKVSADGKWKLVAEDVKIDRVFGTDFYPELKNSNVQIYNDLNYRHWDTWEDGAFSHVFIENLETKERIDIMPNEPFDCPQKPFGGGEDFIWSPDGKQVLYVTKKLSGAAYAISTNTDIYVYNIETKSTSNLTEDNKGYDTQPAFSANGTLGYLQMKRDGYESDKNDIIALIDGQKINLTENWDGTVNSFRWSNDGTKVYFNAAIGGTVQLFEVNVPTAKKNTIVVKQITEGQFDMGDVVGETATQIVTTRKDMNHAAEIYIVLKKDGSMKQLTHANDEIYSNIKMGKVEKRITKTTDGKDMLSWVIYPPDFDPTKKYPTILYCQGGPQGALSQFYSYRWNFQLMAAQGYIIIAPNRRGMPGYGVEWNEQISTDYGGQNMQDYLSAIDDISKEPYVDTERLGCIGASYGGYSAFYLAAIHEKRFKTFVAHDGIFNWKSMYGTTEEIFFTNWDLGGAYWDKDNAVAQKSHTVFNPAERVESWDSPILIIQGGKDYRVPIGQGLEAFQAAKLQGLNSRLLYFPEENHWVLDYQNSVIWHSEFFKWLEETL
ncbi:MAG: S9 family peptidase [Crocinitomicaceae bacterium]|jgi:dipeptidyl aminopeptidase/acylaminoacyl peptidase|nr:S9 family peptidase [Crocinitomicaceae bacterium]